MYIVQPFSSVCQEHRDNNRRPAVRESDLNRCRRSYSITFFEMVDDAASVSELKTDAIGCPHTYRSISLKGRVECGFFGCFECRLIQ